MAKCDHCDGTGEVLEPSRTPEEPGRMIPCANCAERPAATVPLAKAIEIGARLAMEEGCPFTGVSGDFDACSSTTRQVYEARSAQAFGVTLADYYAMEDDDDA